MENSNGTPTVNITVDNEMIFAARPKRIQTVVCDKTFTTEISEDFTLPDYQPDIRRLLRITPSVSLPSRYVNHSLAEFSGNVGWSVLYVGGDGSIAEAKLASPYEAAADFETSDEVNADSFATDEVSAEGVVGRVTAPRKLTIRARLKHHIRVCGEKDTETDISGAVSPESVKRLTKTIPVNQAIGGIDDSIELEDRFQLPDSCRVISSQADVTATDCETDESAGIICRGNVCLKLMYINEDKLPTVLEHRVPFTANVICSIEGDGWSCRAHGELIDLSVDTEENEAVCRMRVAVAAETQKNLPAQFTTDIFSTESTCEKELNKLTLPCSLLCTCQGFSHDGSAVIDGLPEGAQIINSDCSAEAESITLEKGHYILNGKCRYNTLFGADGEYSVRETELPFRCELDSGDEQPTDFSAIISVVSCRVRPEGENYAFSADFNASVRICGETEIEAVSSAVFNGALAARNAAFTVTYTSPNDSLWDIAKRYGADPAALAEANGLRVSDISSSESLAGVKYLIV